MNIFCRRSRSLSLSAVGSSSFSTSLQSPLRSREHTSEAGSPTLEQALLMQRTKSPSRGEFRGGSLGQDFSSSGGSAGDCLYSGILTNSFDGGDELLETNNNIFSKPSFSEVMGIDRAVEEAAQRLDALRLKQAEVHRIFDTREAISSVGSGETSLSCVFPLLNHNPFF